MNDISVLPCISITVYALWFIFVAVVFALSFDEAMIKRKASSFLLAFINLIWMGFALYCLIEEIAKP